MKAFVRYAVPAAALVGLTVALAPAASASVPGYGPRTASEQITTQTSTTNPCNGWSVDTAGLAEVTIITDGPESVVRLVDAEMGDGYTFTQTGISTFDTPPAYEFDVQGTWVNNRYPGLSFHGSLDVVVNANDRNAPTTVTWTVGPTYCGAGALVR